MATAFTTIAIVMVVISVPILIWAYLDQMCPIWQAEREYKSRLCYRGHNLPEWSD